MQTLNQPTTRRYHACPINRPSFCVQLKTPRISRRADTVAASDPPPFDLIRPPPSSLHREKGKERDRERERERGRVALGRVGKWCQVHSTGASTSSRSRLSYVRYSSWPFSIADIIGYQPWNFRLDEVEKQQVAKRLIYWQKLNEEFIYLLLIAIRLLSDVS